MWMKPGQLSQQLPGLLIFKPSLAGALREIGAVIRFDAERSRGELRHQSRRQQSPGSRVALQLAKQAVSQRPLHASCSAVRPEILGAAPASRSGITKRPVAPR